MSQKENKIELTSKVIQELSLLWLYSQSIAWNTKLQSQNSVISIMYPSRICDQKAIFIDWTLRICFEKIISAVHHSGINSMSYATLLSQQNKLLSIFCVPVPKNSPNNHTFNALLSLECLYKFSQNHRSPVVMSYSFITKNQVINFSFIYIIKIFLRYMKIF